MSTPTSAEGAGIVGFANLGDLSFALFILALVLGAAALHDARLAKLAFSPVATVLLLAAMGGIAWASWTGPDEWQGSWFLVMWFPAMALIWVALAISHRRRSRSSVDAPAAETPKRH